MRISKVMKRQFALLLALVLMVFVLSSFVFAAETPKYIFMFIGDGMGIAQRQVAEIMLNSTPGQKAVNQDKRLVMNSLEAICINTTYDSSSIVPDSASTATSLVSGYKTLNGVIGMREDKTTVTPLLSEVLKKKGYSVGIISSVKITHATPAAFYAHVPSRNDYDGIAVQMINSGFDLFVGGGGGQHFNGRKDGRNLYAEAEKKGYTIANDPQKFMALKPGTRVIANLPGDVYDSALPYAVDRKAGDLSLTQIVKKSIEILSTNPKGFLLAVEEGKVDWACHANDTGAALFNMLDFDQAIAVALEFKKKHPETLIVVTGDHECGGLGLSTGQEYRVDPYVYFNQKISFEVADSKIKEILAAEINPKEKIFVLAEEFGLTGLTDQEKAAIEKAIQHQVVPSGKEEMAALYGGYQPISLTFSRLMSLRANLFWTSYVHTGVPVMTTASGVGAEKFAGYIDNTDICKILNDVTKAGLSW